MNTAIAWYTYVLEVNGFTVEVHERDLIAGVPSEETVAQIKKALDNPGFKRVSSKKVIAFRQLPSREMVVLTEGEHQQLCAYSRS